jgi:hypothetical protein
MMTFIALVLVAFSVGFLIHLPMRFWSGNLGRGSADRRPLGVSALLGLTLGTICITAYLLKWGQYEWVTYEWERGLPYYQGDPAETWGLVSSFLAEYANYPEAIYYHALPSYLPGGLWEWMPVGVAVLLAIPVVSLVVRKKRGQSALGPVQDIYMGFFAPLGLVPLAALLFTAFAIVVGLFSLLIVALMVKIFWPGPVRRY